MRFLVNKFIEWAVRGRSVTRVVTFDGRLLFYRYEPFWPDEWQGCDRPPWWRPFNILLHQWKNGEADAFHDHPRWSVSICLKGQITEKTPWKDRVLRPGSVVFRSRKNIHAFDAPAADTWTLFIVGRRNYKQNSYAITPRSPQTSGLPPEIDK